MIFTLKLIHHNYHISIRSNEIEVPSKLNGDFEDFRASKTNMDCGSRSWKGCGGNALKVLVASAFESSIHPSWNGSFQVLRFTPCFRGLGWKLFNVKKTLKNGGWNVGRLVKSSASALDDAHIRLSSIRRNEESIILKVNI